MEGERRLAQGIPARLSPREGRKFGLAVGMAFLVLAALSRWRGHQVAPAVLAALGGLLFLAGVTIPGRLGAVHRAWMGLALAISRVTTPLFMGLIYFVVLTPTGLLMRLFGKHPLKRRAANGSFWVSREPRPPPLAKRVPFHRTFSFLEHSLGLLPARLF